MSEAKEFSASIKEMGDKIAGLTLKEAKELSDYLEEAHGIKAAAGGAVMMAAPGAGAGDGAAEKAEEKTEFDVILENFGADKISIIKIVRAATGASLGDAKTLVETAGAKVKTGIPKEEAEKLKKELEEKGAKVSVK